MNPIADQQIPRTAAVVRQGMADGLHIGAQIYASISGRIVADAAWGFAKPGTPMTTQTVMRWLSSAKPATAVAIGQLWERGRLELDDPVARHIPEFAAESKQSVTLRHLLTHTAGLRGAAMNASPEPWEAIIAKICAAPLEKDWTPGAKAGYDPSASWLILGEIVRRLDGRPFEQFVRDEIFLPLEMEDSWLALPTDRYQAYGDRMGVMQNTSVPDSPKGFATDSAAACALCRPGSSGRGPIRQLGFFYEAILARGSRNGRRILSPQTVEALISRHRCGMFDHTFKHVLDWGLGFIVDNNIYGETTVPYPFGRYCSPRTVGHGGYQSSVGFADPQHALAVAIVFNGCPGEAPHGIRIRQATAALYEDLALAPPPALAEQPRSSAETPP
jgi:CubicO group peptidase (beta-lactamase class C family)